MLYAAIYNRISDDKQIANTSLPHQEETCRHYVASNGWKIFDVVTDEAVSANKNSNTRVIELLNYCKRNKGKFKYLVVYKLDRFARSQAQHHWLRAELLKLGIYLRSATENIGENGSEKLVEGVLAAVNEYDNDIRKERCSAGMIKRLEEGLWPWNPPKGYYLPKEVGKRLAIAQIDEACVVGIRQVFELYASGNYTFAAIVKTINKLELSDYKGRKINLNQARVEEMLSNRFYIGLTVSKMDNQVRQGKHQPLITMDLWERCQKIKDGRNNRGIRKSIREEFPLRGFVFGPCDHPLTAAFSKGKMGVQYGYYFCNKKDSKNYPIDTLHTKFDALLEKIEPPKESVNLFFEMFLEEADKETKSGTYQLEQSDKQIQLIENKLQRLLETKIDGDISRDVYLTNKQKLDQELIKVKKRQVENKYQG